MTDQRSEYKKMIDQQHTHQMILPFVGDIWWRLEIDFYMGLFKQRRVVGKIEHKEDWMQRINECLQ